jgi:hypothetical protein
MTTYGYTNIKANINYIYTTNKTLPYDEFNMLINKILLDTCQIDLLKDDFIHKLNINKIHHRDVFTYEHINSIYIFDVYFNDNIQIRVNKKHIKKGYLYNSYKTESIFIFFYQTNVSDISLSQSINNDFLEEPVMVNINVNDSHSKFLNQHTLKTNPPNKEIEYIPNTNTNTINLRQSLINELKLKLKDKEFL